ncbi:MAG: hypothetical protein ACOCTI_07590 [Phycisphaeraceae bacterium]
MIAACFSLVGFAAAAVVGIAVGNRVETILLRAMGVMLIAWVLGYLIGAVANQAIGEYLERYKAEHPLPENADESQAREQDHPDGASEAVAAST